MNTGSIVRYVTSFGNVLIAASLLSALVWWRAGLYLFAAAAAVYGLARAIRAIDGAWNATPSVMQE